MKQTVTAETFQQAFHAHNRYSEFGCQALNLLFKYLDENYPEMELDVIAICSEYACASIESIAEDYSIDFSDCEDEDERTAAVRDWLNERTVIVGEIDDSFETDAGFVFCTSL